MQKLTSKLTTLKKIDLFIEIPKYIPFLTVVSFLFNSVNLSLYYTFFGIDIFKYIELTEILTQLLKDLVILTLFLLSYFLLIFFIIKLFKPPIVFIYRTIKRIKNFFVIIVMLIYTIPELNYIITRDLTKTLNYLLISIFSTFNIIIIYQLIINRGFKNHITRLNLTAICIIIFTTFVSSFISIDKVISVRLNHRNKNDFILYQGKKIQSTDTYYFIGQTKSTIFFYDEIHKFTDCYYKVNVTKIELYHSD